MFLFLALNPNNVGHYGNVYASFLSQKERLKLALRRVLWERSKILLTSLFGIDFFRSILSGTECYMLVVSTSLMDDFGVGPFLMGSLAGAARM